MFAIQDLLRQKEFLAFIDPDRLEELEEEAYKEDEGENEI